MSPDRRQLEIQNLTKDIAELQNFLKDNNELKGSQQWRNAETQIERLKRKLSQLRRRPWELVFRPPFSSWVKLAAAVFAVAVVWIALAGTGVTARVRDMFRSRPVLAPSVTTAKIKVGIAPIFAAPERISKSLYEAQRGESIHVIKLPDTEPSWVKVQLVRDGQTFPVGFIQRQYLTFDGSQELKWALNSPPPESDGMEEIGSYVTRLEDFQPPTDPNLRTTYYTELAKWEEVLAQRQTSPEAAKPYKDKAATYRSYAGQNAPELAKTGSTEAPKNQASGSSQLQSTTPSPEASNTRPTGTTASQAQLTNPQLISHPKLKPLSASALAEGMQKADKLYRDGYYDDARHELNFLLSRNPDFREARELRDKVIAAKNQETGAR